MLTPSAADVRAVMAEVSAASELADAKEAIGWLVVTRDDEYGGLHISGVIATPEEALIVAQRDHADVHRGHPEGEPGWTTTVEPLFSVTP